ncbi:MAG: hypothetical protein QXV83_04330 [Candidatus Anstonellaceae archaeon]
MNELCAKEKRQKLIKDIFSTKDSILKYHLNSIFNLEDEYIDQKLLKFLKNENTGPVLKIFLLQYFLIKNKKRTKEELIKVFLNSFKKRYLAEFEEKIKKLLLDILIAHRIMDKKMAQLLYSKEKEKYLEIMKFLNKKKCFS